MTQTPDNLSPPTGPTGHPALIADVPRPKHPLAVFFDRFLVLLFVAAIVVPFLGTWLHWDPVGELSEKRTYAPWPRVPDTFREATRLPDAFLNFFRDHFGFRNTLIHKTDAFIYALLGAKNGDSAIIGKDGWYFLHVRRGDRSFAIENGFLPFTEAELDQWQAVLERRQKYLADRGIPLIVVIPPDKQSIYPEFFPMTIRTPTRLDQLIRRLEGTHSPVTLIDLRPALLAGKSGGAGGELYLRTDTHWNARGAYIGYREIMEAVGRALPGPSFTVVDWSGLSFVGSSNFIVLPVAPEALTAASGSD